MKLSKIWVVLAGALAISACQTTTGAVSRASVPSDLNAAQVKLYELPLESYYGSVRVGRLLANGCDSYEFDTRLDSEINERRNEQGRGSFAALSRRKAVQTAMAQAEADIGSQYGVNPRTDNLCAAASAEVQKQSVNSALLIAK
ncbi:hypothetical protein M3P21_10580 [Ruegeria sp. 2012CJ41-6]|uniref:Lipoprotein n=1 Tax=Ruegeria spongiae TaxID=2942209 RepID=A0ABT0Q269_9RHOB|nr:hypothetical protein [Ruegeria spongiae]MCL6283976.1 hypothetical protein [Ruegeria spongiae]